MLMLTPTNSLLNSYDSVYLDTDQNSFEINSNLSPNPDLFDATALLTCFKLVRNVNVHPALALDRGG